MLQDDNDVIFPCPMAATEIEYTVLGSRVSKTTVEFDVLLMFSSVIIYSIDPVVLSFSRLIFTDVFVVSVEIG